MVLQLYGFLGDGGKLFSGGFLDYLRELDSYEWCSVRIFEDSGRDYQTPTIHALSLPKNQPIAGIGYSLGAWGAAWWQHYMFEKAPERKIALIAGIDPAGRIAGAIGGLPKANTAPIHSNVQRCICVSNTVPWSPLSWIFGGGQYVKAVGGPQIDYRSSALDHLWMQFDKKTQAYITAALRMAAGA